MPEIEPECLASRSDSLIDRQSTIDIDPIDLPVPSIPAIPLIPLFLGHRLRCPTEDNSDEEDVLVTPPSIPLPVDDDDKNDVDDVFSCEQFRGPELSASLDSFSHSFPLILSSTQRSDALIPSLFLVPRPDMAIHRQPSMESLASTSAPFPPTPPLPKSTPPVLPASIATPYLDQTPMRDGKPVAAIDDSLLNDEDDDVDDHHHDDDDKENRTFSEDARSSVSSYCSEEISQIKIDDRDEQHYHHHHHHHHHHYHHHHHNPAPPTTAFLPSTPSNIPLIDDSPSADMTKRSYNVTSLSATMQETSERTAVDAAVASPPLPSQTETPSLPKIRAFSGAAAVASGAEMPVLKTRQPNAIRGSSLKANLEILPTPSSSSSSSSSALSSSMLTASSTKHTSTINKFRYTSLWNGAVSALRENVAIKRRKKGGFTLWSSATGTMDIFSGQDATNVLLNYLLEKKSEFTSANLDRSKAVRLGQQLMNNGYYKPVKKSGGRGQEASVFEDSASKFYLFCDKASLSSSSSSSSSSTADSALSTSTLTSTSTDDDASSIGFEGRRNSMRHRKGRLRHPSDPGTPHSRF